MLNGVKIDFNFSQEFYLKEIAMDSKYLLFETTDGMNYFKDSYEYGCEYNASLENRNIIFKLYFDDYKDLDNIPYLLYKYLRDNDMLYDD